jgi:hypothetical protein
LCYLASFSKIVPCCYLLLIIFLLLVAVWFPFIFKISYYDYDDINVGLICSWETIDVIDFCEVVEVCCCLFWCFPFSS